MIQNNRDLAGFPEELRAFNSLRLPSPIRHPCARMGKHQCHQQEQDENQEAQEQTFLLDPPIPASAFRFTPAFSNALSALVSSLTRSLISPITSLLI
jgi:hypothetical protein